MFFSKLPVGYHHLIKRRKTVETVKVTVFGAAGRMGSQIVKAVNATGGIELAGAVERAEKLTDFPIPGTKIFFTPRDSDDLPSVIASSDVVIDVSGKESFMANAALVVGQEKPMVIGSTSLNEQDMSYLRQVAECVPCVLAPNFSLGVNLLFWLTERAASILGEGFDPEIMEIHHRRKKDSPSGTAKRLAEIIAEVRGWDPEEVFRHGRQGMIGERPDKEIGVHSLRAGDVVGDHTVFFAGAGERLEFTSRVGSRDAFAQGAIRAALWIVGQISGLYDMQDVLGLR
ncbi:MAG: 4-hydroxy-tetrahydrodipicolinate reductase [Patescibacteria group bacterium]|nr:4-hydroxy-tetrahydrodipicolinate reductase [Patescibacteria group bacterium]